MGRPGAGRGSPQEVAGHQSQGGRGAGGQVRKKKRRREITRRGGKKRRKTRKEKTVKIKIFQNNIRGLACKQESLEDILENKVKADIVILNETATRGKRKINLKNYLTFTKNHPNKQSMGGISTSVADWLKESTVKVSEDSEYDEYMIVRVEGVCPALNIINMYGAQEGRDGQKGKDKILASWSKIKKELCLIEMRGEAALLIGDMNRAVGADERGVKGNKVKVSFGGCLIRELVEEGNYKIFNNLELAVGGPWTRKDPAYGTLSCLDLAIGSANLLPFLKTMEVDSERRFTPYRVKVSRRGEIGSVYPDHYPVMLELEMPTGTEVKEKERMWNVKKPGGWDNYKSTSDKYAEDIIKIVEDEEASVEDVYKKFDQINDKIRYISFGKTKVNKSEKKVAETKSEDATEKNADNDEDVEDERSRILRKQTEKIEKHVRDIRSMKLGRLTNVFKMKDVISGPKKAGQEAAAIKDSRSGNLVVSHKDIKKATIEYCADVLTKNVPEEGFEKQLEYKEDLMRAILENKDAGSYEVEDEEFWKTIERLKIKNKRSYDFLVKSGDKFKGAVLKLCKRILHEEKVPEKFYNTLLHQIYKGVGCTQELSSSRFVHTKDWAARVCESLAVSGMREDILSAGTIYQIGGKPGMRTQYHLFTIKSVISLKLSKNEGLIFSVKDIKKFFDKEGLVDTCVSLNLAGADSKCVRLWWKLNEKCRISAMTGAGKTEEVDAGPLVGQGGVGSSLASQLNIDMAVDSYFRGSRDEECYGSVRLQPLLWQDDLGALYSEVRLAQASDIRLSFVMKEKGLEIHPVKSGYLVFGPEKFKEEVRTETEKTPIICGEIKMNQKKQEKYLGDILDERGLAASVEETVRARLGKVRGAILELTALSQDFRMAVVGGTMGALDIWEICIVASLLSNCGTWTEITEQTEKLCEDQQNMFIRSIMRMPGSTPIPALRALTGLMGMRWRIWREKLILILAIQEAEEDTLARRLLEEQVTMGWPGLSKEGSEICQKIGLPE